MVVGEPPAGWTSTDAFADIPALPDIVRRAMGRVPSTRYQDAQAMIVALDWMDVMSSKMSPHTQDIPLWMEASMVGNIPVPVLNAAEGDPKSLPPTLNPARRSSSRPPPIRPPSLPPSASFPPRMPSIPPPPVSSRPPPAPPQKQRSADSLLWMAVALAIVVIVIFLAIVVTVRRNRQRPQADVGAGLVVGSVDATSAEPPASPLA
jgi:hypothetical protein